MWINKAVWDATHQQATMVTETIGRNSELVRENIALHTTLDWFRVRTTQLEKERAQLLYNYVGIKTESPVYAKQPDAGVEALTAIPSFDDVGDKRAESLGIGWNADGTLNYAR